MMYWMAAKLSVSGCQELCYRFNSLPGVKCQVYFSLEFLNLSHRVELLIMCVKGLPTEHLVFSDILESVI